MPTYKWLCEVTGLIIQIASFVFLSLNTYYFQPYFFFNHLLYSKMWLKLGNDSKISLQSTTPNFHSIASLHSTQPFSTCRNNMGLSYFRYSCAQWYPLETEIHLYSYVQSRLESNLESPRLHSTPPLHSTF